MCVYLLIYDRFYRNLTNFVTNFWNLKPRTHRTLFGMSLTGYANIHVRYLCTIGRECRLMASETWNLIRFECTRFVNFVRRVIDIFAAILSKVFRPQILSKKNSFWLLQKTFEMEFFGHERGEWKSTSSEVIRTSVEVADMPWFGSTRPRNGLSPGGKERDL